MTRVANGKIEHDSRAVHLCCSRKCCARDGGSNRSFEPRVEAGLLGRLREVRRPALELRDLFAQPDQELLLVDQAGANLDDFFGRAGHALAEPEGARVIFAGVVDGLERLAGEFA